MAKKRPPPVRSLSHRSQAYRCDFCKATTGTAKGLKSHIKQSETCRQAFERRTTELLLSQKAEPDMEPVSGPASPALYEDDLSNDEEDLTSPVQHNGEGPPPPVSPVPLPHLPPIASDPDPDPEPERPSKRAHVVNMVDQDETDAGGLLKVPFVDYTPGQAVKTKGVGTTMFEKIRTSYKAQQKANKEKENLWYPFKDAEEWSLVKWLLSSGLSQKKIDKFLKLEIVSLAKLQHVFYSPSH